MCGDKMNWKSLFFKKNRENKLNKKDDSSVVENNAGNTVDYLKKNKLWPIITGDCVDFNREKFIDICVGNKMSLNEFSDIVDMAAKDFNYLSIQVEMVKIKRETFVKVIDEKIPL